VVADRGARDSSTGPGRVPARAPYDAGQITIADPNAASAGQACRPSLRSVGRHCGAGARGGDVRRSQWMLTATRRQAWASPRSTMTPARDDRVRTAGAAPLPVGDGTLALLEVHGKTGQPADNPDHCSDSRRRLRAAAAVRVESTRPMMTVRAVPWPPRWWSPRRRSRVAADGNRR